MMQAVSSSAVKTVVLTAATMAVLSCSHHGGDAAQPPFVYVPPVTFSGYAGGALVELPGHRYQPNTCGLHGDTVKMFMCSADYDPAPTPTGIYMRLELYPIVRDSLDTLPITKIGTAHTLLKYCDHTSGATQSYQISPADSSSDLIHVGADIRALERRGGGRIHLVNLSAEGRAMPGTNAAVPLSIVDGVVEGTVQ
jgi:hypothetical protein